MYQMAVEQNIGTVKPNINKVYSFFIFAGTISGLMGGILMMLAGLFLSAEIYMTKLNFHNLEVVFLASGFVLLGIGSHCLDLIEKERRKQRK